VPSIADGAGNHGPKERENKANNGSGDNVNKYREPHLLAIDATLECKKKFFHDITQL
jgi:hypothetical protein